MVRIGAAVTSYLSPDGVTWLMFQREDLASPPPGTPALPPLTSVGLALTARNNLGLERARLDNVVVKSYPPYPPGGGAAGGDGP